ncbi:hypothetical protein OG693_39675 (plasmid) [Streptomyces sp. NBC_01259]|uniref:hypothetical protein n=1 Tax=Streptomyces sp. NBC_01259 TaxID=2903800 RepID=UPI002F90684B
MARVRYIGAEPVTVPELGKTVQPDELVEVPDNRFDGYACQPTTWEVAEEPKTEWRGEHGPESVAFADKAPVSKKTTAAKPASTSKEG